MSLPQSLEAALAANIVPPPGLSYGTAGFRANASLLPAALFRVGVVAALRSASLSAPAVGVMVTASHNPACDNGAKIVDGDGGMLCRAWEDAAGPFVNAQHGRVEGLPGAAGGGVVVLGGDTRASTGALVEKVREGVEAAGGTVEALGVCTTPQLHFAVWSRAGGGEYFGRMVGGFEGLRGGKAVERVVLDCANGVGSVAAAKVRDACAGVVELVNCAGDGELNFECGADYVQKKRAVPTLYSKSSAFGGVCASLDGDADRLVVYKVVPGGIVLADGDRFSALTAMFVRKHLGAAGMAGKVSVGVAQTAYSNGGATEYLCSLTGVEVVVAKTGVKHLEVAVKDFDIGIYWEPNGHGTVLYSQSVIDALDAAKKMVGSEGERESVEALLFLGRVANQAVGDGIADLLLVLGILAREGMTFEDWVAMYEERCSHNLVVRVADKSVIATEDCDRAVVKPVALRDAVAEACGGGVGKRAFVRPSGTEDVVRVYAEAPAGQKEEAERIARKVADAVFSTCEGVGERP